VRNEEVLTRFWLNLGRWRDCRFSAVGLLPDQLIVCPDAPELTELGAGVLPHFERNPFAFDRYVYLDLHSYTGSRRVNCYSFTANPAKV